MSVNHSNQYSSRHGPTVGPAPPPEGNLSIVFTDIVKSTAIWETNESAMVDAMQMHDDIIRSLTEAHHGYEVKQNGDGFMIAFPTASSALQFCLNVQQQMLTSEWPKELIEMQPGQESNDHHGKVVFRGLKLRMSAHWGEPVCKWNEVIKRMDYLGPVVNRAARFIQATEGGQIVVSEEFLLELRDLEQEPHNNNESVGDSDKPLTHDDDANSLDLEKIQRPEIQESLVAQEFEIEPLGKYEFDGLTERRKLYLVVPHSLRGRLEVWPKNDHIPGSKGNLVPG